MHQATREYDCVRDEGVIKPLKYDKQTVHQSATANAPPLFHPVVVYLQIMAPLPRGRMRLTPLQMGK